MAAAAHPSIGLLRGLLTAFGAVALASACLADPPATVPPEFPEVGPPPEGDLLPPVSDEMKARSAVQMLLVVVGGLTLIGVLLRLVGRRSRGPATQSQAPEGDDPFERARRVLEELDRQRR